jgi:hypothetical protein
MRRSHNTSDQIRHCLSVAGIEQDNLVQFLSISIKREPPKHRKLREAIRYKIQCIQAERLLLLLTAA